MDRESPRKRVLVIGGTGFIGSNLVRYLSEKGNEVAVFHRKGSNLKNLENIPFESKIGDLADDKKKIERDLFAAMQGCQVVYNLAAFISSLKKYRRLMEIVNKEAVEAVAYVARKVGVERLIHVSSSTAVGYPKDGEIADENFVFNAYYDHYALIKRQGQEAVLKEVEKGLNGIIAIPGSTIGVHGIKPGQLNVFRDITSNKMLFYPPGGLCLTNVNDLVRGLYLCYEKGLCGKRYILGGHNITYKQYFTEIANTAAARAPRLTLPKWLLPKMGWGMEIVFGLLGKEAGITRDIAVMLSRNLYYSSQLAKKELGYTITDWKQTIRDTVKQCLSRNF